MAKKPKYRWRPAPRVGAAQRAAPTTVVVNPPSAAPSSQMPSVIMTAQKNPGSTIAVVLGLGAVAFAVLELTGVTHVFTSAPTTPPPPPKPAAPPATPSNPVAAGIAAGVAAATGTPAAGTPAATK